MHRTKLGVAALAVATLACLIVMHLLREPRSALPATDPVMIEPARDERVAAPLDPGAPPPAEGAPGDEARLASAARAAEAQEQALRSAILEIGEDASLPLDARLERYRQAMESAREQMPDAPIFEYRSMVAEVFLRMDGVQRELAALAPAARSRTLAHIRRELGFDDEQIARMEAIDARREARWQNGLAYMQERARVAATFEGDALEAELRALRDEYFADEAPTIEAEERDGFFRFERPRIYGRN